MHNHGTIDTLEDLPEEVQELLTDDRRFGLEELFEIVKNSYHDPHEKRKLNTPLLVQVMASE